MLFAFEINKNTSHDYSVLVLDSNKIAPAASKSYTCFKSDAKVIISQHLPRFS